MRRSGEILIEYMEIDLTKVDRILKPEEEKQLIGNTC